MSVSITQSPFKSWLEANHLNSPHDIYNYLFDDIQNTAALVGIDLQFHDLNPNQNSKNNRLKVTNKAYKGKVVAFSKLNNHLDGIKIPFFSFITNKHGQLTEVYNAYQALYDLFKQDKPLEKAHPITPRTTRTIPYNDNSEQWKQSQFDLWTEHHTNATNNTLETHPYFIKKFGDDVAMAATIAKKSGVKRGLDAKGDYLIFPLANQYRKTTGYQKIYAKPIDEQGRDKDFRFLPNGKNGSFLILGNSKNKNDTVFIIEGLSTGLTVQLAKDKAVFVALDAGNIDHTIKVVKALGFKKIIIGSDNDIHSDPLKGNTGLFSALKAAKKHNVRIFKPELDNIKCDFNDLHKAKGLNAVTEQLKLKQNPYELNVKKDSFEYQLQLLTVCPQNQIKKVAWFTCKVAANNLLKKDLTTSQAEIEKTLTQRGAVDIIDIGLTLDKSFNCLKERVKNKNEVSLNDAINCDNLKDYLPENKRILLEQAESLAANLRLKNEQTISPELNPRLLSLADKADQRVKRRANKFIAEIILSKKGVWLDHRPMGTGKTELMGAVISQAEQRNLVITYLCHRQSLVENSSERLQTGSYKDLKTKIDVDFSQTLAICINSITNKAYSSHIQDFSSVILIDEIRQTLECLATGTVANRNIVYDALITAINNADYVIGSDADLNQLTIDWLKANTNKPIYGLTCNHPSLDKTLIYGDYLPVFNAAVKSVEDGVKTLIQSDSIKATQTLYQALKNSDFKILVINSENKGDPKQAAFLKSPNTEIINYDAIIHSPVISSGVSLVCDHIQAHFALFTGVLPENDILQMLGRNRPSKKIIVGFSNKHAKNRINSVNDLFRGEAEANTRINDGDFLVSSLSLLIIKITARRNDSLNNYAMQSILLASAKGYKLECFVSDDDSNELLSESSKQAKETHVECVKQSDDLTEIEGYKMQRTDGLTQQESYALEKYNIKTTLAVDTVDDDEIDLWDGGRVKSVIENNEISKESKIERNKHDLDEYELKGQGGKHSSKGNFIDAILEEIEDEGGYINLTLAVLLCEFLQNNYRELAANGLGSYQTIPKYKIKIIKQFLEKFGYSLESEQLAKDSEQGKRGERIYKLMEDNRIKEVVARRKARELVQQGIEHVTE